MRKCEWHCSFPIMFFWKVLKKWQQQGQHTNWKCILCNRQMDYSCRFTRMSTFLVLSEWSQSAKLPMLAFVALFKYLVSGLKQPRATSLEAFIFGVHRWVRYNKGTLTHLLSGTHHRNTQMSQRLSHRGPWVRVWQEAAYTLFMLNILINVSLIGFI